MSNLTNFNSLMKQSWSGVAVLSIFYIVIVIALSLMSPWFFSFNNAMNIGINMSYIGLMAAAGTPLIIAGGLDLSVAAVAGLTGVLITIFFGWIDNIWLAVFLSLCFGAFIGAFNGDTSGNADTATKLASAVNIGGVSFDGSASINLPGVNIAGNQNTSGNAATASTAADLSFGSANQVVFKNSSNGGTTSSNLVFDGTNLTVAGDITAFASDDRLKTNKISIDNAGDKVKSLNGFTFNFNDIGASLGFDKEKTHAGVSAQEVQKVLPEAVTKRADGEYLTVKYEKLIPLLIEAIKELSDKVDELEQKLSDK